MVVVVAHGMRNRRGIPDKRGVISYYRKRFRRARREFSDGRVLSSSTWNPPTGCLVSASIYTTSRTIGSSAIGRIRSSSVSSLLTTFLLTISAPHALLWMTGLTSRTTKILYSYLS
jgi:hypothetical protein